MSINEPDVADSARIPIGKAAKLLGINRTTLLKHTMQGLIKCGFSRVNGRRIYRGNELKRYWRTEY